MSDPVRGENRNLHNGAIEPASVDEINYSIRMDCDDDVIVLSVRMYKFFMAHGPEGREAKELYEHLIFTSRMQYGNQNIRATMNYLMKGLGWGEKKVKRAKTFLSQAGLIEYIHSKDDKSGVFTGHTILVKRMWDEASLSAWLERKTAEMEKNSIDIELAEEADSVDNLVDNSTGAESDPVAESLHSCPQGHPATQWVIHPSGGERQTNKVIKRETYKREKEETTREEENPEPEDNSSFSPPAGSFSEKTDTVRFLESVIELDGDGKFFFPPNARAALEHFIRIRSVKWVLKQFEIYREKKTAAQIRRFCETDLPKFLTRAHESTAHEKPVVSPQVNRVCPVCGAVQPVSGTMNYCPKCTLPGNEFDDPGKVAEHKTWWEEYSTRESAAG